VVGLKPRSLASLHILHINEVSDQTFGLRLKFETLVSAKIPFVVNKDYQSGPLVEESAGDDNRRPLH